MKNLNKINNKLKYEKYCNYTDDDWNDYKTYGLMSYKIITFDFINTFKDKIRFDLLFKYHTLSIKLIEKFIDLYDSKVWDILVTYKYWIFTEKFINKYYQNFNYPIYDMNMFDIHKIKPNAIQKLNQLKIIYEREYISYEKLK